MIGLLLLACGFVEGKPAVAQAAPRLQGAAAETKRSAFLSAYWPERVQRWASLIYKMAYVNGLDPDFVAAVVMAESSGDPKGVSYAGAVGLMGVMPSGPGLEFRPSREELTDPHTNLAWGVAILTDIIQQSGGDVFAALAAYNGGWSNANRRVPQQYAAAVLDDYARALIVRTGGNPEISAQWTLAIEMRRGHIPTDSLLVLGTQPVSGLQTYSPHVLYDYINEEGASFYIKGYAVPVAAVVAEMTTNKAIYEEGDQRPTLTAEKTDSRNPRVILTCLATSTRLRSRESNKTRWFSPSSCPEWRRP